MKKGKKVIHDNELKNIHENEKNE